MNTETVKTGVTDDRHFRDLADKIRADYRVKSSDEREKTIVVLAKECRQGGIAIDVVTILSMLIDPENYRMILSNHLPDFESFFAQIK